MGIGRKFFAVWAAAYIALTAVAAVDYNLIAKPQMESRQPVNALDIRRYRTKVDGREREFTVVGEVHSYNRTESELVAKLMPEYDLLAHEVGNDAAKSSTEGIYFNRAYILASKLPMGFLYLGEGRTYPGVFDYASQQGREIIALEDGNARFASNRLENLTNELSIISANAVSNLVAPAYYLVGKVKADDPWDCPVEGNTLLQLDYRDGQMAQSIVRILSENPDSSIAVFMGKYHVPGVERSLSRMLELQ